MNTALARCAVAHFRSVSPPDRETGFASGFPESVGELK